MMVLWQISKKTWHCWCCSCPWLLRLSSLLPMISVTFCCSFWCCWFIDNCSGVELHRGFNVASQCVRMSLSLYTRLRLYLSLYLSVYFAVYIITLSLSLVLPFVSPSSFFLARASLSHLALSVCLSVSLYLSLSFSLTLHVCLSSGNIVFSCRFRPPSSHLYITQHPVDRSSRPSSSNQPPIWLRAAQP